MKLASYNLWNHAAGLPHRQEQTIGILTALHADILFLQEDFIETALPPLLPELPYHVHHPEAELSLLSRYPIKSCRHLPYALAAVLSCDSFSLCAVNIHLPWDSAPMREQAIVAITEAASSIHADYTVLAGDFNCSDSSSVHRYLCGEQSLCGHGVNYFDLAEAYASVREVPPPTTLDFRTNPRWGVVDAPNTLEKNQRFDRILLENPYPAKMPVLLDCGIFGTEISPVTHLAASDHWGVYGVLDF